MGKMVNCKTCGQKIAKTAKVCPNCGAKQHQGAYTACTLIAVLTVIACIGVLSGGGEEGNGQLSKGETGKKITGTEGSAANVVQTQKKKEEEQVSYQITYQDSEIHRNDLLDTISFYAIVEVENTGNVNLHLKDASFDFEDADGSLLATNSSILVSSDPDIIAPGEKGYFYCDGVPLNGNIDENTYYVLKPNLTVEKTKRNFWRYEISDLSIAEGDLFSPLSVIGRITNNTEKEDSLVWIPCVLYGKDNMPIAAFGTNVTELQAGETRSFDISAVNLAGMDLELSDVADYKVFAGKIK